MGGSTLREPAGRKQGQLSLGQSARSSGSVQSHRLGTVDATSGTKHASHPNDQRLGSATGKRLASSAIHESPHTAGETECLVSLGICSSTTNHQSIGRCRTGERLTETSPRKKRMNTVDCRPYLRALSARPARSQPSLCCATPRGGGLVSKIGKFGLWTSRLQSQGQAPEESPCTACTTAVQTTSGHIGFRQRPRAGPVSSCVDRRRPCFARPEKRYPATDSH